MILSSRVQHAPRTHASYPMNSELAPCFSTPELLASPPTTPPRYHTKHSFSKPITWLHRSSSSTSTHSAPYPAQKPTRISEPKFRSSLDQLGSHRAGQLGSGATIVRTPQEALFGSTNSTLAQVVDVAGPKQDPFMHEAGKNQAPLVLSIPAPSPPLPPLPGISDTEADKLSSALANISLPNHAPPPRSPNSPSSPARVSPSQPTFQEHSRTSSRSTATLPADTNLISPPPFEAILLSPIPEGAVNPSKIVVTLETCTTIYRTTLRSLASRPSHLSRYISSLLQSPAGETASVYSSASSVSSGQNSNGFSAFFRDHLTSSGCFAQSSGIHVFLDRPSAPYTHVLAYLRSAPSTPEHPETLPRAVTLGTSPSESRLESLHELREEASYLGLVELEMLCCHEIRRSQRALLPTSVGDTSRGKTESVHSVRTVVEARPYHKGSTPSALPVWKSNSNSISHHTTKSSTRECTLGLSFENKNESVRERGKQRRGIKYQLGSPPPGWI